MRRNPKLQAPNYKQISNSNIGPPDSHPSGGFPVSMTKTGLVRRRRIGHCYLPFDLAQGGESFDFAQDREPVERLVEPFDICDL